jgi:hypothetical protein
MEEARRLWVKRIMEVEASDPRKDVELKVFKPKFPKIPKLDDYRVLAPENFWEEFPVNLTCPGVPSLEVKKLKQKTETVGAHFGLFRHGQIPAGSAVYTRGGRHRLQRGG